MDKFTNLICGITSVLGFTIALGSLIHAYYKFPDDPTTGAKEIILILTLTIVFLILFLILLIWHFSNKTHKLIIDLEDLPIENNILHEALNQEYLTQKLITDCSHTTLHYYRNILKSIDIAIVKLYYNTAGNVSLFEKPINEIVTEFERFISTMLTNITNTCNAITGDQCATCIKIIKNNKVKTFYRDPMSYRMRQGADHKDDKPFIYDISDNYAFKIIADPTIKETAFICDNLKDLKPYENRNPKWSNLYNATAVIPIEISELEDSSANKSLTKRSKTKKNIIGFLCVDNLKGGFESRELKDFLAGFGDLLFNLFEKFDIVTGLIESEGIKNDKITAYKYWN